VPSFQDVLDARERLGDEIVLTPCPPSTSFTGLVGGRLFLKLENRQRTGSFKARGAGNRLAILNEAERARGVVTASAGNHAQAVAYHANRLAIPATVVMPSTTPMIKVANTRAYGANVVLTGATFAEALEEARRLEADRGLIMVHAFDDEAIIAGQGTIGIEIAEQVPDVTCVVVPIGGGGVISGTALALKALKPEVRVIGVEAEAAASALASRRAGAIVPIETSDTIADGIAIKQVGDLTFPLIEDLVDEIVTVSEDDIANAILLLLEREKTVVEGAGAVPIAALTRDKVEVRPHDVVVAVLCGGNIDVNMISRIIDRGLVADGRLVHLRVKVRDRPGYLARLTSRIAETGANVLHIGHRRAFEDITVGEVQITLDLETRGREHVEAIVQALEASGYAVTERA
jgi:threonine dehydratase